MVQCPHMTRIGAQCKNPGKYKNKDVLLCFHHVPKQDVECTICLRQLYDSMTLPCEHSFHLKCIVKWLSTNKTCPLCREIIYESSDDSEETLETPYIRMHSTVYETIT